MTLKNGTPDKIQRMFRDLERSREQLIKSIVALVYFMRGAIQYRDMLLMTPGERDVIDSFVADRLKHEQGKMYPVY